jgi:hypothetical protein
MKNHWIICRIHSLDSDYVSDHWRDTYFVLTLLAIINRNSLFGSIFEVDGFDS